MKEKIVIGSRASRLAVRQAVIVMESIRSAYPHIEISMETFVTTGDKILDKNLDQIGGKGLFVRELDQALLDGRIDVAVHSLKDMPMDTPGELPILAYSGREDPRDALILPRGTGVWDGKGVVGCSSARRKLQLKKLFPNAVVGGIRGNVQTRLDKLDRGEYAALVLACAGLKRLDLENRISRVFEPEEMLPAAGQGILAVQGRRSEGFEELLACVNNAEAQACAIAERAFVRALGGGCTEPVAAFARMSGNTLRLDGWYLDETTGRQPLGSIEGDATDAERLGRVLAERLKGACK